MNKLQPIQIDENTVIYVEATDNVEALTLVPESDETTRTAKGWTSPGSRPIKMQSFQAIENTIKLYTKQAVDALRNAQLTELKKVTLEFGVNVSGMGGIPYIASGTAECNIRVTVECEFPKPSVETTKE